LAGGAEGEGAAASATGGVGVGERTEAAAEGNGDTTSADGPESVEITGVEITGKEVALTRTGGVRKDPDEGMGAGDRCIQRKTAMPMPDRANMTNPPSATSARREEAPDAVPPHAPTVCGRVPPPEALPVAGSRPPDGSSIVASSPETEPDEKGPGCVVRRTLSTRSARGRERSDAKPERARASSPTLA
jgi:hypothetical protein